MFRSKNARRVKRMFEGESLTEQQHAIDVNLPGIMTRHEGTRVYAHVAAKMPQYGDFTDVPDFQEAQNRIAEAKQLFLELPARIRDEFRNDQDAFIKAASDPAQKERLTELGFDASYLPDPPQDVEPPEQDRVPESAQSDETP